VIIQIVKFLIAQLTTILVTCFCQNNTMIRKLRPLKPGRVNGQALYL